MKFWLLFFAFTLVTSALPTKVQKQKYLYPLGEKIFKKKCRELSNTHFDSFRALYKYIHTRCWLEEKRYEEALVWYLWDKKYIHTAPEEEVKFAYTKKDKCPVCGMFVYKYPQWVAMARDADGKELYFDGVKDMLKYYFSHQNSELRLYGQDYYSKKIIDLHNAWLVLGSDVYSPMGEEIIPFANKSEAESFLLDHHGKKVVRFDELKKRYIEVESE